MNDSDVQKFRSVYSNIPEAEKRLTIVIIDDKKISWEKANKEIEKKTELGERIIDKLISLEII